MDPQARKFLRTWLVAALLLAAIVGAVNAVVDPYLLINAPRIEGFNARKARVQTNEQLMKAYEVQRAAPDTLILGTSRVDMGLDTRHPAWPDDARPIYNLGLAGGNLYTAYRYLQHVAAYRQLKLVVLGLDFETMVSVGPGKRPVANEFERWLATNADGTANAGLRRQRVLDLLTGNISLDSLSASFATVVANLRPDSADLTPSGDLTEAAMQTETAAAGSYQLFSQRNQRNIRVYRGAGVNDLAMQDLRAILALCAERGTRVILLINPVHADMLETYDLLGYWPHFEAWKRQLVTLVAGSSGAGQQLIPLWDFSGYDAYSSESVTPEKRTALRWYWEPSHYGKALGGAVLERIFGAGDPEFGVLLAPETIDSRIGQVREAQRRYREQQPADVQRMRDAYVAAMGQAPNAKGEP